MGTWDCIERGAYESWAPASWGIADDLQAVVLRLDEWPRREQDSSGLTQVLLGRRAEAMVAEREAAIEMVVTELQTVLEASRSSGRGDDGAHTDVQTAERRIVGTRF